MIVDWGAIIIAIMGGLAGLFWFALKAGSDSERVQTLEEKLAADAESDRLYIEAMKRAEAAREATSGVAKPVTSATMTAAEFKAMFGYEKPHGND